MGESGSAEMPTLRFSGHETFPLRFAWIPKAATQLKKHPNLFQREDDFVLLGVGKNMAKSIQYWCEVTNIVEKTEDKQYQLTDLATIIFGDDGLDPYLEHDSSLWLMHWMLTRYGGTAGTAGLVFSSWPHPTFSKSQLEDWLLSMEFTGRKPSKNVIERDIGVMTRLYVRAQAVNKRLKGGGRVSLEESFDSPLTELGLLNVIPSRGGETSYRFNIGSKPSLRPAVLAAAMEDYWYSVAENQATMKLEQMIHGLGSPGSTFKLTESVVYEMIESMHPDYGFTVSNTAGMSIINRESCQDNRFLELVSYAYGGAD